MSVYMINAYEHWNYTKTQTPAINENYIDDYVIESTVTQPNLLTKVNYTNGIEQQLSELCGVGGAGAGGTTQIVNVDDIYATIANNYETAILTQLTPPHSPPLQNATIINNNNQELSSPANNFNTVILQPQPQQQQQLLHQQQQQQQQSDIILLQPQTQQTIINSFNWSTCNNNNSNNDLNQINPVNLTNVIIDNDIQTKLVDEIVNSRAKELIDWHDELDSISCSSSSLGGSFLADESVTDNSDYLFDTTTISSASASPRYTNNEQQEQQLLQTETDVEKTTVQTKKRRPYGRNVEDRKIRKKEQNKNAATRYRQKKKIELEIILSEEQQLLSRHQELKKIYEERKREAKYLKTLLREFYHKQQLLNTSN